MIAAVAPSPLWYLSRGTGIVTLVLLTASIVLGIMQIRRWAPVGSPRFVVVSLHRAVSLLVVALLAVHVLTSVLDSYAPIRLVDAVLPFAGSYRPIWLGLGAVALDMIIALTVTSLLRHRLGLRAWRAVHWAAYACWPVALVHGLGTGSDTRTTWMLVVALACTVAVVGSIGWRLAGERAPAQALALGACVLTGAVVGVWLALGPLADGWARRAGTPAALLASRSSTVRRPARSVLERPFSAGLSGTVQRGTSAGGLAVIDLRLRLTGGTAGVLRLRIAGDADPSGGVVMQRSAVTLGPPSAPGRLRGRIDALQGTSLEALVRSAAGRTVRLQVQLTLRSGDAVGGTISGAPVTEASG